MSWTPYEIGSGNELLPNGNLCSLNKCFTVYIVCGLVPPDLVQIGGMRRSLIRRFILVG